MGSGRTAWACTGMYHYYQQTGDQTMRKIIDDWFCGDRFAEGATTKTLIRWRAVFLTLYRYEEDCVIQRIYRGWKRGPNE